MRHSKLGSVALAGALALALASCSGGGADGGASDEPDAPAESLTMLIGSSGEAETTAVQAAADAWAAESGVDV